MIEMTVEQKAQVMEEIKTAERRGYSAVHCPVCLNGIIVFKRNRSGLISGKCGLCGGWFTNEVLR